jgi:hypothetical protein
MTIDEIANAMLLGARGGAPRLPALPEELAAILPKAAIDPENALLDMAASMS